jgi:hypothetical protein
MSWLAGCSIARAETAVVVDEAGEGEMCGEMGGEDVEVPFFEAGEAVGEDEARVRAAFGRGRWVEPAAEGYSVSCFERDILTGHDGWFEINFKKEERENGQNYWRSGLRKKMGNVNIYTFPLHVDTADAVSTHSKFGHPPVRVKHYFEAENCLSSIRFGKWQGFQMWDSRLTVGQALRVSTT